MHQAQTQISKLDQLRDQNFSNGVMLNCLAALENLAHFYKYPGQRIFDYYSGYSPRNNENSLIDAIIMQLEIFRASYSNYSSIYGNYDFPKNLTKEQIIKIVLDWEKFIPYAEIKVFYDEIIFYLNGRSDTSGISGIIEQKRKEWGPTTEKQLSRIAKATPFINSRMHNEMKRVKQSYQNGNYEIKAKLYQNQSDDVEMADLNKNDQNVEELVLKFNEMEKKITNIFKSINKNMKIDGSDRENIAQYIKSFEANIKVINPGEDDIKKKIKLFEGYKKDLQKYKKNEELKKYLLKVLEDIENCYKNQASNQENLK